MAVAVVVRLLLLLLASRPVGAAQLDWTDWRTLPVYDSGRAMPLDTFARSVVEETCGRANPRLSPPEADAAAGSGGAGEGSALFPDGKSRRFTAAELVFSWLSEPGEWEDVPFLLAAHEGLRRDVLGVALADSRGRRLKYVSPRQFEQSAGAAARLAELARREQQARASGSPLETSETDRRLEALNRAYLAYRLMTFDPRHPQMRRTEFVARLMDFVVQWRRELSRPLALWQALDDEPGVKAARDAIDRALAALVDEIDRDPFRVEEVDAQVAELCRASEALAKLAAEARDRQAAATETEGAQQRRRLTNLLAGGTVRLARQANLLRAAVYDNGRCLRVVPALGPFVLTQDDEGGEPWIALRRLLLGSPAALAGYPAENVAAARKAFDQARAAYLDRQSPAAAERFVRAMRDFGRAVRTLAEATEPLRRKMAAGSGEEGREAALAATAYPPPGAMRKEVLYNWLDPFLWAWILTFASLVIVAIGFHAMRTAAFFVGAAVMAAGQAFTIAGLLLRASITGMVPVTNMYETVLFVGGTVALLGLWFAMLPISWPVIETAWWMTAIAPTPRAAASAGASGDTARWLWRVMPVLRGAAVAGLFYVLAIAHFNPSEDAPIFPLVPSGSSGTVAGLAGAAVIWLVGLAILVLSLWFLPRAAMTVFVAALLTPRALWLLLAVRVPEPVNRTVARRPVLLAGGAVALVAYLVAYYAAGPVFHREVGQGMAAVLRSNFWLALHVLVVTASYAAGALAWALGNISLGYYALGRYRDVVASPSASIGAEHRPAEGRHAAGAAPARRPPAICAKLSRYIYQSIQVAVVLLAAGTITGAIWADYAWGRYWGWDPKEVWALISLLVYMVVLHGRWAGWTGNFGTAVGAVLGATAIMMAWYGVNFVIRGGLHSYGQSAGGEFYVGVCVAANWLLMALATMRRWMEGRRA